MSDLKERMRQEAIARMVSLNLHPVAINDFKDNGKLRVSLWGVLYLLDKLPLERVLRFEEETGCMVYHVIHNVTNIGELLTFLYVSKYPEDWPIEQKGLIEETPLAYVVNLDDDICSEFGSVRIQKYRGGLIRII